MRLLRPILPVMLLAPCLSVCGGVSPRGLAIVVPAAPEIAEKVDRADSYARLLVAVLPKAAEALTEEERRLVVSDEDLAELREPVKVKWTDKTTDAEAEDAMITEEDED